MSGKPFSEIGPGVGGLCRQTQPPTPPPVDPMTQCVKPHRGLAWHRPCMADALRQVLARARKLLI